MLKFTKKAQTFVINAMEEEALFVEQIVRKYGKKENLPSSKTIHRYAARNADFYDRITAAYNTMLMAKVAEYDDVGKTPASELYPSLPYTEARDTKNARLKVLYDVINRVAPILNRRFSLKQEVEHKGNVNNNFTIEMADYTQTKVIEGEKKK